MKVLEKIAEAVFDIGVFAIGFGIPALMIIGLLINYWKEALVIVAILLGIGLLIKISNKLDEIKGFRLGDLVTDHIGAIIVAGIIAFVGMQIATPNLATSTRTMASTSYTVYITSTGHKYHRAGCRYLRYSSYAVDLEKAMKNYSACSICRP